MVLQNGVGVWAGVPAQAGRCPRLGHSRSGTPKPPLGPLGSWLCSHPALAPPSRLGLGSCSAWLGSQLAIAKLTIKNNFSSLPRERTAQALVTGHSGASARIQGLSPAPHQAGKAPFLTRPSQEIKCQAAPLPLAFFSSKCCPYPHQKDFPNGPTVLTCSFGPSAADS